MPVQVSALRSATPAFAEPFLRIPPFPGSDAREFVPYVDGPSLEDTTGAELADLVRRLRVGGTYWGGQPDLPSAYVLVRSIAAAESAEALWDRVPIVLWGDHGNQLVAHEERFIVTGECDPWHLLSSATAFIDEDDDDLRLIACLLGVEIFQRDSDGKLRQFDVDPSALTAATFSGASYVSPFTGLRMEPREAIELCGFWRRLVDSNRAIAGGLGFAFWKRDNIGTLLWSGSEAFEFIRSAAEAVSPGSLAVWRSKVPSASLRALQDEGISLVEVEDGFLRSHGLGADCVPPLSITVDKLGAYFDPSAPSELEQMLQMGAFDEDLLERASLLRETIVASGLSKYGRREGGAVRRIEGQHILVPGQVEDDRSVQTGGCGISTNLELLRRVRERAPYAYILYKAHPDVVAGHRIGAIPDRVCRQYADEIVGDEPITSLIAMVDEVHVNTSLAGFEALMREKAVTTYGVPFYAGWGLTTDLGPVPARRTATRELDELVAATLLLYPRYLDPATGLPCPPEVVVARLCAGYETDAGLVVTARRIQGKFMRSVRSLVS